jgi:hypothetical protein
MHRVDMLNVVYTMVLVLAVAGFAETQIAHATDNLAPGDRYQSGYDHGRADALANNPDFCANDHTAIYCSV